MGQVVFSFVCSIKCLTKTSFVGFIATKISIIVCRARQTISYSLYTNDSSNRGLEAYRVTFANTNRLANSAIPYMQVVFYVNVTI